MQSAERVHRQTGPEIAAPAQAAPVASGVGSLLALQRKAGNRATTAMLSGVQRKVAKSTTPGEGPVNEIADASLSGDAKAVADKAATAIKAGPPGANPWNAGKKWKWGAPHGNHQANLPGVQSAGGYTEYYLSEKVDEAVRSEKKRLVVGKGEIYYTDTHYGEKPAGSVPFTHYGSL